jgi:hypothetical protein
VLTVLQTLEIRIQLAPPATTNGKEQPRPKSPKLSMFTSSAIWVIRTLQDLEFLKGSWADGFTCSCVGPRDRIQPHTADGVGCEMLGVEILVGEGRIFFDQLLKDVIPDAALPLGRANAGIVKGPSDPLGRRAY